MRARAVLKSPAPGGITGVDRSRLQLRPRLLPPTIVWLSSITQAQYHQVRPNASTPSIPTPTARETSMASGQKESQYSEPATSITRSSSTQEKRRTLSTDYARNTDEIQVSRCSFFVLCGERPLRTMGHPERSRSSGGAKDLRLLRCMRRAIPPTSGALG